MGNITTETAEINIPLKKILIDVTFLFDQNASRGLGRYGKELIRRLINLSLNEEKIQLALAGFLSLSDNLVQFGFSESTIDTLKQKIKFFSFGKSLPSGVRNIFRWRLHYKPVLEEYRPEIFFSPNFERGVPSHPFLNRGMESLPKTIVTVYDVIPIATNRYTSKSFLHNIVRMLAYKFMYLGVEKADTVITISNFSKEDIIRYTSVDPQKIKVIYLGVSDQFKQNSMELEQDKQDEILEKFGVKGTKYFLYDSGLEPNKGINEVLQIIKRLKKSHSPDVPAKLIVVGKSLTKGVGGAIVAKDNLGEKFLEIAEGLGVTENIVATDRISDQILRVLLFNATAYLYLSQYEGFGFGPVQAMAAEIPAIGYNGSCIPEITDGGALLINTKELDSASRQIVNFLEDKEFMDKIVLRGKEVSERYNWDETAKLTWIEIKRLL